ncbi:MAG: CD1375 family protein [Lachnotalea sp.]
MAELYASLIRKGLKTIEEVPLKLQDAVKALLEA